MIEYRPKWLVNLTSFLIDNLAVLATIGYASYVIYRKAVLGSAVTTDDLLTAILAVLGLLAISEIVERYRKLTSIEKSSKNVESLLKSQFADRPSAITFFEKMPSLETYTQNANSIDLCGLTLTSTVNKQFSNIRERLKQGTNVRLLIVDPDSLALEMSSLRSETPDGGVYFRKRIEASLQDMAYLYKSWKESQENSTKNGSLSISLLPYAPSFSILMFNGNQPNGMIIVELYAHKTYMETVVFTLTSQRDGNWYDYFVNQFEVMWKDAKEWKPIQQEPTDKPMQTE